MVWLFSRSSNSRGSLYVYTSDYFAVSSLKRQTICARKFYFRERERELATSLRIFHLQNNLTARLRYNAINFLHPLSARRILFRFTILPLLPKKCYESIYMCEDGVLYVYIKLKIRGSAAELVLAALRCLEMAACMPNVMEISRVA